MFLCHNGTIKLGDFGIATFIGNSKSGSVRGKDNAKTAIGTPVCCTASLSFLLMICISILSCICEDDHYDTY